MQNKNFEYPANEYYSIRLLTVWDILKITLDFGRWYRRPGYKKKYIFKANKN